MILFRGNGSGLCVQIGPALRVRFCLIIFTAQISPSGGWKDTLLFGTVA